MLHAHITRQVAYNIRPGSPQQNFFAQQDAKNPLNTFHVDSVGSIYKHFTGKREEVEILG